jgi:hypothetical protein
MNARGEIETRVLQAPFPARSVRAKQSSSLDQGFDIKYTYYA